MGIPPIALSPGPVGLSEPDEHDRAEPVVPEQSRQRPGNWGPVAPPAVSGIVYDFGGLVVVAAICLYLVVMADAGPTVGILLPVAVGCALLTDEQPSAAAPLPGLIAQRGNQRPALAALDLLSTVRLDGHRDVPDDLLDGLDWPTPIAGAHRAPLAEART